MNIKRQLDFILGGIALVGVSPLIVMIAFFVWFFLGRPIFFRQQRPGLHGEPFRLVKFRTMTDARDDAGVLLPDSKRLTPVGRLLRSTSLDELPELWNVVKGQMSLVGPRPLLMEYLPLYNARQRRRHEVRPGITGWAQVNGRNDISWQEKFELDVWYVENRSFALDLKILVLTVKKMLLREGISAKNQATIDKFKGNFI